MSQSVLLALPAELRLKIWQYCCHLNVDCKVLDDIVHTCDGRSGTQALLVYNTAISLAAEIPWINLSLTCKAMASEIRSFITDKGYLAADSNCTYIADFNVHNDHGNHVTVRQAIRQLVWRTLPCKPIDVKRVVLNVNVCSGSGPWTDGGAATLARALFQIMNHLVHLGPTLRPKHPLPPRLKLKELVVNVDIGIDSAMPRIQCSREAQINFDIFIACWADVTRIGFMYGCVERANVVVDNTVVVETIVENKLTPMRAGRWRGWGFLWGV